MHFLHTYRERLTLVLLVLLPFHALAVTVLTKLLVGPGKAPLAWLALWKEALLGVILVIALAEIIRRKHLAFDILDYLIAALILIAAILPHPDLKTFALGFKYDFVPLVAFLILRRVNWSDGFKKTASMFLLAVGAIVAAYGILTLFLPMGFFTALGYSDLHSLYVPSAPLAAFQQIEGIAMRRIQSTMSGPNQLGLWLLIPWSILLMDLEGTRWFKIKMAPSEREGLLLFILIPLAIILTFSRSAWIAAAFIALASVDFALPKKIRSQFAIATGVALVGLAVIIIGLFPNIILRVASTSDHFTRPLEALHIIKENPLGLGLGSAGPASNRNSDTCVMLPKGSDASWASGRQDLCIFVGGQKVQPFNRECHCPLLPENWYLQIGVELGIAGMLIFIVLIGVLLKKSKNSMAFLPLLGISIAALFLHAWEDAAVAYTVWLLLAGFLSVRVHKRSH